MNVILYKNGSNEISFFIKDCIKRGNNFYGSNTNIASKRMEVKWTNDIITPIFNTVKIVDKDIENIIGWDKTVDEVKEEPENREIKEVSEQEYREAVKLRKVVSDLTYIELDNYIENNVIDLPSAKTYLKKLSKVVLALSRMVDKKI